MSTATPETARKAMQLRPDLIRYFEARPKQTVYLADLEKIRPDASKSGLQNAARMLGTVIPLETITAGQAWRYRPDWPTPTNAGPPQQGEKVGDAVIFTLAGKLANGTLILEDENGQAYKAVPISI